MRTRTSNRNEFTFNIGCVVSIFDTLVFVARSGGRWASRSSIERKKKSRKSIGAPWVYASSYAPFFYLISCVLESFTATVSLFSNSLKHRTSINSIVYSLYSCSFWRERGTFRQICQQFFCLESHFDRFSAKSTTLKGALRNFSKRTKGCASFIERFE